MRLLGHRGALAERPENTMVSFARAVELGVDVLELDVHLTADRHVVVSHDPDGRRMAGVGRAIADASFAEVRRWDAGWGFVDESGRRPFAGQGHRIVELAEVLEAFPAMPLNVDIKQRRPPMVRPLLELLRGKSLGGQARVTLASFYDDVLAEVRAEGWRGPMALGRREVAAVALLPEAVLRFGRLVAGSAAQVPRRAAGLALDSPAFIAKCHALGLRVDYWTINDPAEARLLLARGADGLISDDPAALAEIVRREKDRLDVDRATSS